MLVDIIMEHRKDTKNCHVYDTPQAEKTPYIPTLYIRKYAFETGSTPRQIRVTVSAIDA
jgi:hypothetical protein